MVSITGAFSLCGTLTLKYVKSWQIPKTLTMILPKERSLTREWM